VRPAMQADNMQERIALWLNLAPVPVAEALFLPAIARSIAVAQRIGLFKRLAKEPASVTQVAGEFGLTDTGARFLLDSLVAIGHLRLDSAAYSLSDRARKWLDPASDQYVGTYIEHSYDYWEWWDRLEEVIRTGKSFEIHDAAPGDPSWRVYIRGQYELARLSAPEVARAIRLPQGAKRLLDVAGGHGWFSAELCRRHEGLEATVFDLAGSAAVGREIIADAGMSDRVRHVEGDLATGDFGGPYDGALCFNIIHHLTPEQNVELFRRVHDALAPGGTFAVLDLFTPPGDQRPDAAAFLGMFFYLTSAAATYAPEELFDWLDQTGFERPRKVRIRRIPNQTLYEARKRPSFA
jgi:SAM-dependent methyltransferase